MNSAQYEKTVSDLVCALAKSVDGLPPEDVHSGKENRLKGASGYSHQIDVSFQAGPDLHVIECKCWKRRVTVEAVLTLIARVLDIQGANSSHKVCGALATTKGVQSGAEKVAAHYDIELQFVQSANEFALRYKNHVHIGMREDAVLGDSFEAEVTQAQRLRPDFSDRAV